MGPSSSVVSMLGLINVNMTSVVALASKPNEPFLLAWPEKNNRKTLITQKSEHSNHNNSLGCCLCFIPCPLFNFLVFTKELFEFFFFPFFGGGGDRMPESKSTTGLSWEPKFFTRNP